MEEDDLAPKLDMILFLYDWNWKKIPQFQKLRYQFICYMDWNLRVTPEECEEVGETGLVGTEEQGSVGMGDQGWLETGRGVVSL